MEPKDRIETLVKTKAGAMKERMQGNMLEGGMAAGAKYEVPREELEPLLADWPPAPKKTAELMIEQYGVPNEATPTMLIWHQNGPWKKTVVTRDEGEHNFPTPHTDYISQTIDYRVPIEKLTEIGRYDRSIIVNLTSGEATAACDAEPLNILALNLMHEVASGGMTAEDARKKYADEAAAWSMNRPAPLTEALQIADDYMRDTRDPDQPAMAAASMKNMAGKVKDVVVGEGDAR